MNGYIKIKDLRSDKGIIEEEINEFISEKLTAFMYKYGLEDIEFGVDIRNVYTESNKLVTINIQSHIKIQI